MGHFSGGPLTTHRKPGLQAILNDNRVKEAREAGRGGRVRDESETASASTLTLTDGGRKEASATADDAVERNEESIDGAVAEAEESDARKWIEDWREKQPADPV